MEPTVEILSGASHPGTITIRSTAFTSRAWIQDGNIHSEVTAIPQAALRIFRIPFPLVAGMLLDSFLDLALRDRIVAVIVSLVIVTSQFRPVYSGSPVSQTIMTVLGIGVSLFVIAVALRIFVTCRKWAPWHGAEHMAIRAWMRDKTTELSAIRMSDRVDQLCGTRYSIPNLVTQSTALWFAAHLAVNPLLAVFVGAEIVLWADRLIGFERIPVLSQASDALQRHLFTKEPDEIHLLTAQCALESLVQAHRNAENGEDTLSSVSNL